METNTVAKKTNPTVETVNQEQVATQKAWAAQRSGDAGKENQTQTTV